MYPQILFEDADILAINKPCGLVVNKSVTTPTGTLQDFLSDYLGIPADVGQNEDSFEGRAGIVHRLDKDTSGVLLVAKNPDMFVKLQRAFKSRNIIKEYAVVVYGSITDPLIRIDAPICRDNHSRNLLRVCKNGKPSRTDLKLVKVCNIDKVNVSALWAFPYTGRTHQIRVHLAAIGNAVVGDRLYSSKRQFAWSTSKGGFNRMMLHAHRIVFNDREFSAELPNNFTKYFS